MRKSTFVALLVVGALLLPTAVFASHQFNDVPDSHLFHTGISWMKDNNITVGCNPPANTNYCPDDNVTRGQMATFMKRLAENNVVDAATLDGADSTVFQSPSYGAAIDWSNDGQGVINANLNASLGNNVLNLAVTAPTSGVFALTYNLGVFANAAHYGGAWLQYDNATCNWASRVDGSSTYFDSTGGANNVFSQVSTTIVKSTAEGDHTISLCAGMFAGTVTRNDANIAATFSGSGVATAGEIDNAGGGSADPTG